MKYIKILFCLLLYCYNHTTFAQTTTIDSLKNRLHNASSNNEMQIIVLKITEQFNSLSADSLQKYVNLGLRLYPKNSDEYFQLKNHYVYFYLKSSKAKEANLYIDTLLAEISNYKQYKNTKLAIGYNKAICLIRDNQYKQAMDSALNLLKESEELKDSLSIMKSYSALGLVNMELENEAEAILWLNKGIRFTKNEKLLAQVNSLYLNLASCYRILDKFDSALIIINKGLDYSIQVENLTNQANALNIRAGIFSKINRKQDALKDLEDALVFRKKVGDTHYLVADMGVLAFYYSYINQPSKAIQMAKQGIDLALKTGNTYKLIYLKKSLANAFSESKLYEKAYEISLEIINLKDSMYEANTEKSMAELQTKYELQKKESIIFQQENKIIRSKYITYASTLAFFLGSIIAWLLYRNYKHISQRKMQEALAEEKINSMKAIQEAEEKERKRIAADLHDNLGSYAAAITSNIRYLKEKPDLENKTLINQLDENAQGIVTQLGDSIWILKNEQLSLTKLADRLKSWIQKMILNYPRVTYYYEEAIMNDTELNPSKILNLFLILKEIITNSLKHSNCTELRIFFQSDKEINISIEDNGIGFKSNLVNNGSGIENIKFRVKDSGLSIHWDSKSNKGTKVIISNHTSN